MFKKKNRFKDLPDTNQTCKNCGTSFIGKYCPHCSQSVKEFEQPISFMIVDFVGNMFAFDTRFWRTFKAVLYKPGEMTNEFVKGHRVRYMPPFRFYIFMSFVFFFLLNYSISKNFDTNQILKDGDIISVDTSPELVEADSILRKELGEEFGYAKTDSIAKVVKKKINKTSDKYKDESSDDDLVIGNMSEGELKKIGDDIKAHPDYFISRALSYISWALFLFMPFFAFLLWVFFRRSYRFYVIHLIFAINQHAFLFIVFSVMIIINILLPEAISSYSSILLLLPPIYHFIGAKQLYKKSNIATIGRLLGAGFIYHLMLVISFAIIVTLSTIGVGNIISALF